MKNYAIYVNGKHMDTNIANNQHEAIADYLEDHPGVNPDHVTAFYINIP